MPDTISRIKLEAQGADQAAREIRKLRDAYDEVAAASKGIGASVGGGDPFSKATAPKGGGTGFSVPERAEEDDRWRRRTDDRLRNNQNYPASQGGAPSAYGGSLGILRSGENTMMAAGQGQMASAAGSASSGIGSLLGGPVGMAMAAVGLGAMATQKLANTEKERMDRLYGGGQVQRLGMGYETIRDWEAVQGFKGGIPLENIQAFISAASNTGLDARRAGVDNAAGWALEANANLGLDVNTSAGLLGAMSRANLYMGGDDRNYNMYAVGNASFGPANMGKFIGALTESVETRSRQGITVTDNAFKATQAMLGGLEGTGLSVDASAALTQRLEARGIQAAQLQTPEDLLAMNALRGKGMSLTDAQIMMEENPQAVIGAVYERMKGMYANEDVLNLAFKDYTKGSMSETVKLREYLDSGMSPEDAYAKLAEEGTGWRGQVDYSNERKTYQVLQTQLLKGLQKNALELTKRLAELTATLRGGVVADPKAYRISFGDRLPNLMDILDNGGDGPSRDVGDDPYSFGSSYDIIGNLKDPNAFANLRVAGEYFGEQTTTALQVGLMENPSGFGMGLSTQLQNIFPMMLEGIRKDTRYLYTDPDRRDSVNAKLAEIESLSPEAYDTSNEIVAILNDLYFLIKNPETKNTDGDDG